MNEKKRITEKTAGRYRRVRKKEKGVILDEFTALTGYGRSYARLVLRNHGRVVWLTTEYVCGAMWENGRSDRDEHFTTREILRL